MKTLAQALLDDRDFNLGLSLLGSKAALAREIEFLRIQKPGLAIAGLIEAIQPGRVQVLGNTEMKYLDSLDEAHQRDALTGLFRGGVPCIVVSAGLVPPGVLLDMAHQEKVAVLGTDLPSGTIILRLHAFFDEHLSPRITLHGVLLDVFGVGILLTGQSGIGKSECALDLVLRGHRLIADDAVLVRQQDTELMGSSSPLTLHHMEVRGLGIINVRDLFGAASVSEKKRIELIVEMAEWRNDGEYDRLGIDDTFETILNVDVPRLRLPMRPGRNVSAIVEVAARNFLLKQQGHHAAKQLAARFEASLAQPKRGP